MTVVQMKPTDSERTPERRELAQAIEAHRVAVQELSEARACAEKAQENTWALRSKLEKLQEAARAAKAAEYVPPGVAEVRERIQTCQPLPRMHANQHNEAIEQALASMAPPLPSEEELRLQEKIHEWRQIRDASESRFDGLELKITWALRAIESCAGEVMGSYVDKRFLEDYERDRSKLEERAGALRFVQMRIKDSPTNREIGRVMRPLHVHVRSDLAEVFNMLLVDADAAVPQL